MPGARAGAEESHRLERMGRGYGEHPLSTRFVSQAECGGCSQTQIEMGLRLPEIERRLRAAHRGRRYAVLRQRGWNRVCGRYAYRLRVLDVQSGRYRAQRHLARQ